MTKFCQNKKQKEIKMPSGTVVVTLQSSDLLQIIVFNLTKDEICADLREVENVFNIDRSF